MISAAAPGNDKDEGAVKAFACWAFCGWVVKSILSDLFQVAATRMMFFRSRCVVDRKSARADEFSCDADRTLMWCVSQVDEVGRNDGFVKMNGKEAGGAVGLFMQAATLKVTLESGTLE